MTTHRRSALNGILLVVLIGLILFSEAIIGTERLDERLEVVQED